MPEGTGPNAIGVSLGLVGDQWNLLIVQQALLGRSRFNEFLEALPISNAVLSGRLRTLVRAGVLERGDGYALTAAGRGLWPVLLSIWAWERRWSSDPSAADLPPMVHSCGRAFVPALTCRACGESATMAGLAASWGPSGGWPRSVPAASTRRQRGASPHDLGLFPETLSLIGNRWALAMLGACLLGVTRFRELERALQAPPTIVSERLRTFVALGVLSHDEVGGAYALTDKGWAMLPTIVLALAWGERSYGAPEGPALVLRHEACGSVFVPQLCCDQCRAPVRAADVSFDKDLRSGR